MNTSFSRALVTTLALVPLGGLAAPASADALAQRAASTPVTLAVGADTAGFDRSGGGGGGGIGYLVLLDGDGESGAGGGYATV